MRTEFVSANEFDHLTESQKIKIAQAIAHDRTAVESDKPIVVRNTFYTVFGKRAIDIVVALSALIVTFPINAFLLVTTYFDVGRPVFFKQTRIGKDEKRFQMVKFRNMTNERDANGVLLPPEQRVTKWGALIRRCSLDELLNFWCILKGDMSIIGPRPLPEKYLERFSKRHRQRHLVRPGLECPFHSESIHALDWQTRLENDLWYIEHMSFATDIRMFFLLVKKAFSRQERAMSANGLVGELMGYDTSGKIIDSYCIPRKYLSCLEDELNGNAKVCHGYGQF